MRILLLGTSNGVMSDGYVAGLTDILPELEIDNRSVGASPGVQFASYCQEDLSGFDAVIFDSAVNDENFPSLIGEMEYMRRILFQIFSTIASQTRLIVLGLTNSRHVSAESHIYRLHGQLAQELDVDFFDGRRFLESIRSKLPEGVPFYEAESHPDRRLSRYVGQEIAHLIQRPMRRPIARSFADRFIAFNPSEILPDGNFYQKRNRLMERSFLMLNQRDVIEFPTTYKMVGFYVDSCNTRGFLNLSGVEARNKRLLYSLDRPELLIKFVPVINGCRANKMTFVEDCAEYEDSPHCIVEDTVPKRVISLARTAFWQDA